MICQLVAVFTTSICTEYNQLLLAQGVLQGLGNGLLFCPAVALASSYFPPRRRALALSLVACGGATGGMVYPAIAQNVLHRLGFAWTVRIMGFVMLGTHAIVLPFSKPRSINRKLNQSWLDPTAFRDVPYLLFNTGIFFGFWGLFFAYFFVRSYGQEILDISEEASFTLILVINSIGIPGRIIPNYLADRYFGALNVEIPFILITGILLLCWLAVRSVASYYVWVAFYGFVGGGCQSLFQAASSSFSDDPEKIGIRIGMVCTVVSFACLSGAPIAGKLLDAIDGHYMAAQIFGGVVMIIGSAFLLASKIAQDRRKGG
jgi:predicted MFS family arabinose efflux permease